MEIQVNCAECDTPVAKVAAWASLCGEFFCSEEHWSMHMQNCSAPECDPDNDEMTVNLIASGYDWTCPGCSTKNHEIEVVAEVCCSKCKAEFLVGDTIHAYP